jgi:hypothetical protein
MSAIRWAHDLADGSREPRAPLRSRGANVTEMTRLLGAGRVPAGFTITAGDRNARPFERGGAPPVLRDPTEPKRDQ